MIIHEVYYDIDYPLIEPTETNKVQEILRKIRKLKRANEFNDNMYDFLLERAGVSEADIKVTRIRGKKFPDLTYLTGDYILKAGKRIHLGSQTYKHAEILDL